MGFKRQADPQDVEEIPDDEPEARVPWPMARVSIEPEQGIWVQPMLWGSNALGNLHLNNLTNYSIYMYIYIYVYIY
jgi:hypothetical protein